MTLICRACNTEQSPERTWCRYCGSTALEPWHIAAYCPVCRPDHVTAPAGVPVLCPKHRRRMVG